MRLLNPVTNKWYPLPKEQRLMIGAQAAQIDAQVVQIDKQKTYIANQKAYIADLERRLGLEGAGPLDSSDAERA